MTWLVPRHWSATAASSGVVLSTAGRTCSRHCKLCCLQMCLGHSCCHKRSSIPMIMFVGECAAPVAFRCWTHWLQQLHHRSDSCTLVPAYPHVVHVLCLLRCDPCHLLSGSGRLSTMLCFHWPSLAATSQDSCCPNATMYHKPPPALPIDSYFDVAGRARGASSSCRDGIQGLRPHVKDRS